MVFGKIGGKKMNNGKKLCRKCKMEIDKNAKIYEWWYYKYYVTEKVRRDYSMNTPSIVYQIDEEV